MDHSLQSYMERRSTEELEAALKLYLEKDDMEQYGQVIIMLDILQQRKTLPPVKLTPKIKAIWETYMGPVD